MKIGYIRTFVGNETYCLQERLLKDLKCDVISVETASANTNSVRPIFDKILKDLTSGDVLVVSSLNIIMTSIGHLFEFIERLNTKGVSLVSLEENIDTASGFGKSFLESCLIIRGMETKLKAERSSLTHAFRRPSNRLGKKGITTKAQLKAQRAVELYKDTSRTVNEICDELEITRATFYRYLRHMGIVVAGR